jgi:type IV secretion system protein VirD4
VKARRVMIILMAMGFGLFVATQVFAWQYGFPPQLGRPVTQAPKLYWPYAILQWAWWWGRRSPHLFKWAGITGGGVCGIFLLALCRTSSPPQKPPSARWATRRELQRLGLFAAHGVVLGKYGRRIVRYDGPAHVLCVGPTRSGKSVAHVIPTLLDWRESVVVHDPKGELYSKTAAWRRTFSEVIYLHPTAAQTDHYNPLDAIDLGSDDEIGQTQIVADMLGDPDEERERGGAAEHFGELADEFRRGLILHGLTTGRARTLPALAAMLTGPQPVTELIEEMATNAHPAVQHASYVMRDIHQREFSAVLTTARRALFLFIDPRIAEMVSRSDFSLRDVRERARPMSIYLSIPFAQQDRLRPLSRLIIRQIQQHALSRLDPWPRRLLMLTDEVAALGRFPMLEAALDYAAGHGVMLDNISPSLNPLIKLYGPQQNFWEGSGIRLVFSPNSAGMARVMAQETGEAVVEKQRIMVARDPFRIMRDKTTVTRETALEPLLSPTALQQMPKDTVLLLIGNAPPVLLKKAPYFTQRQWRHRGGHANDAPPAPGGGAGRAPRP